MAFSHVAGDNTAETDTSLLDLALCDAAFPLDRLTATFNPAGAPKPPMNSSDLNWMLAILGIWANTGDVGGTLAPPRKAVMHTSFASFFGDNGVVHVHGKPSDLDVVK